MIQAINGEIILTLIAVTILLKAPPIITPIASAKAFPLLIKAINSFTNPCFFL